MTLQTMICPKDSLGSLASAYGELEKRNDRLIYTSDADASLMTEDELKEGILCL